jgi:putative transposase
MMLNTSTYYYRSHKRDWGALARRIRELAMVRVRYGYRRITVLLRREGWEVNHKLVYRLYREQGLLVRTKGRRKIASGQKRARSEPGAADELWSMDFVMDRFEDGRPFRILTVIDVYTRECVALMAARSMSGGKVAAALEEAGKLRGELPSAIRVDNGTESERSADDSPKESPEGERSESILFEGSRPMGLQPPRRAGVHPAREASGQRAHRVIQRAPARRVPERRTLLHRGGCAEET